MICQIKKLQSIFNVKNIFDYSKPVELISFLIDQTTEKGDIILDFSLGAGQPLMPCWRVIRAIIKN